MNTIHSINRKKYYVYLLTNPSRTVLYTGMCNDLKRRIQEHQDQSGNPDSFAGRYFCKILLYYEEFGDVQEAIRREKQIKGWKRIKKERLIDRVNPFRKEVILDF